MYIPQSPVHLIDLILDHTILIHRRKENYVGLEGVSAGLAGRAGEYPHAIYCLFEPLNGVRRKGQNLILVLLTFLNYKSEGCQLLIAKATFLTRVVQQPRL